MLEDQSILKVGHDMKCDWLVFACRGIAHRRATTTPC